MSAVKLTYRNAVPCSMPAASVETMCRDLVRRIRAEGKPGGDPKVQAYIGSPVPALGVPTETIRGIRKGFVESHPGLSVKTVNALADAMWKGQTFEEKAIAIGLLGAHLEILDESSWRMMDRWVDEAVGWALCDGIGSGPIADMAYASPARFREVLGWTKSENYWRRRISAYALYDFVRKGELDKPLALLERLLYDDEFWVQRAVGTWLRECWKKDEPRVRAFLRKHARGLPPVTITVATERAPKAFREGLRRRARE